MHLGPNRIATQVALDYFGTPFLALKARLNSALAGLAPGISVPCSAPSLPGWLPSVPRLPTLPTGHLQGIDDRQISQHPRRPHQQDHSAQGVVGVVWNISRGKGTQAAAWA